jgi:hypothetical protein
MSPRTKSRPDKIFDAIPLSDDPLLQVVLGNTRLEVGKRKVRGRTGA